MTPKAARRCSAAVVISLTLASCGSMGRVIPAPPPGTPEYESQASEWSGIDGYIEVDIGKRARSAAFVRIREYCAGPFQIVSERDRVTLVALMPTQLTRLSFRCGEPETEPETE